MAKIKGFMKFLLLKLMFYYSVISTFSSLVFLS